MAIIVDIDRLRTLSGNLNQSVEVMQGESTKTSGYVTALQEAIQGVNPALAEHLTELKTLYGNIASSLQEHHQRVNGMVAEMETFISNLQK